MIGSINWKRAATTGFLSWVVPFAAGFAAFPLKKSNDPLFETIMSLVMLATAAALARFYFRGVSPSLGAGAVIGALWLAMNLVFDYPMFAYGPMKMTMAQYYSNIGAGYLLYPLFLSGCAWVGRTA